MNASLSLMDIVHARKLLNPEKNLVLSIRAGSLPMRQTCVSLFVLTFLAGCGIGNADAERVAIGGPVESGGSVSVVRYCEQFAEAYLESQAIDYSDLSVRTEKKAEILTWLSNAFAPPDSRFVAGYDCRFTAQTDQGQARTVAVGIFLTGTLAFAHYTKWPNLQLIPVKHVVDETHGRAGYGVFKYLTDP